MNLFRSEEHIAAWLNGRLAGMTLSASQVSDLAHAWWGDRLSPTWRPHTLEQNQAILDGLGLVGPFWELA